MLDRIGRALGDRLAAFPAQAAHRLGQLGPMDRALDKRYRPALALPASTDMLAAGQALAAGFAADARAQARRGKPFLMVPPTETLAHPRLFGWGLEERLLDIVERYLGLPPAYDGMAILYTVADGTAEATRLWHRDREDRRMVKIAVYLNDVDEDGGPFELDSDTALGGDNGRPGRVTTCLGRAGTVIFADTARFLHRGQPARGQDRAAIFYSYFSQRPRHPFFCERSGLTRAQLSTLTADMTPRQRDSTLWHSRLPRLVRAIPSAPV